MKQPFPLFAAGRAVVMFALLGAGVNLHAQTAADVPVREVVLFSSGVGYFQHEGSVTGDTGTQLRFKTGQINDILKSLVLQDLGGGRIGVVTYPSQDPLAKTLGSFQVDISDNPSLGDLLNKLRGARIALAYFGHDQENFSATVLGVEKRTLPGSKEDAPVEKEFLNVVTDRGVRSLQLDKMDRFQLEDAGLQEELNRALAAVAGARDQDKKPVDIRFNGTGVRRVRLGYVVETPVWKASYRLVLAGDNPADRKPKATLQGWAIVENQTDNDWKDVRLSLVSGRPISFVQNLYQPLYVPRPEVKPDLYASLTPQTYEGGQRDKAGQEDVLRVITSSPPAVSSAGGNLSPPRQVAARRRPRADADEPAPPPAPQERVAKHLLAGPVTVFDEGRYAGDAQLDNVPPGETRLLSYGIDLQTSVVVKDLDTTKEQTVTAGKIVKGALVVTRKYVSAKEYGFENRGDHDKTVVVEYPLRAGWNLVGTPKPAETTNALHRFEQPVGAGKTERLTVREENVQSQNVSLLPMAVGEAQFYTQTGEIPKAVREALAKAIGFKQAAADTQRQINEHDVQVNVLAADQTRIRENLKSVDRTTSYATRLLKKLDDQESQIDKLRNETESLHAKLDGQTRDLQTYLNNLNVE